MALFNWFTFRYLCQAPFDFTPPLNSHNTYGYPLVFSIRQVPFNLNNLPCICILQKNQPTQDEPIMRDNHMLTIESIHCDVYEDTAWYLTTYTIGRLNISRKRQRNDKEDEYNKLVKN